MLVIEFPYLSHKGYLLPIIPLTILNHKIWAYVDSGATFSIFDAVYFTETSADAFCP